MDKDKTAELTAAILTLSQGVDAIYEVLRRQLSYEAEMSENKILERFIPKMMPGSDQRYTMWKKHILDDAPIEEYKIREEEF